MKSFLLSFLLISTSLFSQSILENPDLIEREGYYRTYHSEKEDKIYMEVELLDSAFLYVSALSQGIGNNDLFLDRGQIGGSRVVHFKKVGNKLLLVMPNMKFRANTHNILEKKSVQEAFAKSVLYGFPILEKTKKGYLIDITDFLLQDTHGVMDVLKNKGQGEYSLDPSRSALNLERTKSFPKNVEFDAIVTFKTKNPKGREIGSVSPDAEFVTVYQHHSFIELPDAEYQPRQASLNCPCFRVSYTDYSAPIGDPMEVDYIVRHRLEKENPSVAKSKAKEPIIYYLDNGTPEPVRSALLEGASWWNEAFEAIGYTDAFQVRMLPDTVDPLDVRYNVIQWVHRSTRGWSYGNAVTDPRTGEIIKGHVSLGSLRVRQDYKIARALSNGSDDEAALEMALARIRQLGAHEVGHTLGFSHNFAASLTDRASVMDYPHPLAVLDNGEIDLSNAYDSGIGAWDKVSVAYVYADPAGEEVEQILTDAFDSGLRFVTDEDSRPIGGSNAFGHLWDNGSNPTAELNRVTELRHFSIDQFDAKVLKEGEEYAELEDLFVLLYYFHRYQTEAAVKLIGGKEYGYSVKGQQDEVGDWVPAEPQREALIAVLQTIAVSFLKVPESKLALFTDRGAQTARERESFSTRTGPSFDPLSAARSAANFTLERLLHPQRINRVYLQSKLNEDQLNLAEVLDRLFKAMDQGSADAYEQSIAQTVSQSILLELMVLAQKEEVYPQVRAMIKSRMQSYAEQLAKSKQKSAWEQELVREIEHYFENPDDFEESRSVKVPDGSPIGQIGCGKKRIY